MNPSRPKKKSKAPEGSRRAFLMAGGAVITTLSLGEARPTRTRSQQLSSRTKIREIMERYGSEIGKARFVS